MAREDDEIIQAFRGLYSGGLAQKLRDAGIDSAAMPPWTQVGWLGNAVCKCPLDLWVYQEIIWECQPDFLIETGTNQGGSALFFAMLFDIVGRGHVLTVDTMKHVRRPVHPRITYFDGDSVNPEIVRAISGHIRGSVMASLDSLHTYEHVGAELAAYGHLVTPGCYLVVEDVAWGNADVSCLPKTWGSAAAAEFLSRYTEFERDRKREVHLMTSNLWLRRKR